MTGVSRAIVTGGARGIGAAIAARLAADGASVLVIDVLESDGVATAERIGGCFARVDLLDPRAGAALDDAIDEHGGVDVLVNSAGVFAKRPLLQIDTAEWDRVLGINARGTLLAMQAAARRQIADGRGGRIVNIASMAAKRRGDLEGHYAASKAAVVALTRAAALEWGEHGITVNAVCPGYVLTELGAESRSEEQVASWSALSPLGRLGTPEDVAGMVAFLVGPDGGYCTGQAMNVTGGMVMH
jgi:3-oxoacyl-[acyl-carrier protein] reductase